MSETNNGVEVLAAIGGGQAMMAPGGGLSGGKLALADAETGDVLAGKTYYAGDKELKTGTLALAEATATESDVASGKTFFAGDNTLKTGNLKGYVTSPSLSYNAPEATRHTYYYSEGPYMGKDGLKESTFYFVRCTGASATKLSGNKIRITVNVYGGWRAWENSVLGAPGTWTFDVTLN